jgi:nicotinamidase-related amidase
MDGDPNAALPRNPTLMNPDDAALLIIDVQGKLLDLIPRHARIVWNLRRLIEGAQALGIAVAGTEQYPQGLGPTTPELAERLGPLPAKLAFSAGVCGQIFAGWRGAGRWKIVVAGIEAHVCVQQTALDLLAAGYQVCIPADAVGSRYAVDLEFALRRLDSSGVTLTTTEAVLFEWCRAAGSPEFKVISRLVRESPPSD